MTIATASGQTYDSDLLYQLDQIKDMPSREETNRQRIQKMDEEIAKRNEMELSMPPDMRGPPDGSYTDRVSEEDQLHEQPNKDQNDPYTWGMGPSMDRTGPAMVPYPTPKFHQVMGALDEIISPEKIQAGPYNKDTTPAQDNRPDLYIDENGAQRSRKNDEILSPHSSFVDKMAKGLSSSDAQLLEKYYQGYESTHGKWTDEDQKRLQPFQDAVQSEIGHLPGHTSTFAPNGQETIEMHNWDSLLMDKVLKQYKMLNPGRRSEDDSLPTNARPTSAVVTNEQRDELLKLKMTPEEQGMYETHLKNLNGPGGVDNEDGSRSSLKNVGFESKDNGRYYNVPSVYDGKILSPDEAIDKAKEIGLDKFPSYANQEEAEKRYDELHTMMEKDTKQYQDQKNMSTYDKFVSHLEKARDFLEPSFIPTADQFMNADWRGKLGSIIATSMMFLTPGRGFKVTKGETPGPGSNALDFWKEGLSEYDKINPPVIKTLEAAEKGGSDVAGRLLEQYRKIDNPVMRQEFGAIVKEKIRQAAEGGETSPSNISMPEIKLTDSQMDIIKQGFAEGKNNKQIAKDAGIGYTQLQNTLVTKTEQAAELRAARESAPSRAQRKWTEGEDKVLTDWYNDPEGDMYETPASLSHRSESAILQRAKTLGLEETKPRVGSVPRSPKDPTVYAPEMGSGSGGGEPPQNSQRPGWDKHSDKVYNLTNEHGESTGSAVYREHSDKWIGSRFNPKDNQIIDRKEFNNVDDAMNYAEYKTHRDYTDRFAFDRKTLPRAETDLEGKSGIRTPNKVPEKAANRNDNLQIDIPGQDAAIEKISKNLVAAGSKDIPLISPPIEKRLQQINPPAYKKLKQFETEMDYKHGDDNRGWLSKLSNEDILRYRRLYEQAQRGPPIDVKDIKFGIRQMLKSPEPDK